MLCSFKWIYFVIIAFVIYILQIMRRFLFEYFTFTVALMMDKNIMKTSGLGDRRNKNTVGNKYDILP